MDELSSLAITNRSLVIGFYPRLPYSSCLDTNGPALHFHALHSPSLRQSLNSSSCVRLFGSYGKSQKSAHRLPTTFLPIYPLDSLSWREEKKRIKIKPVFSSLPRPQWCRKRALTTPIDVERDCALGRAGQGRAG